MQSFSFFFFFFLSRLSKDEMIQRVRYITFELPFVDTFFRDCTGTVIQLPSEHPLSAQKCLACTSAATQTYSFRSGIYLEHRFIPLSEKWVPITLSSKPFGDLKMQKNFELWCK
jgi:hypothetical protein